MDYRKNYTDHDLYYAVEKASSMSEILRNLGFSDKRGHKKLLEHIRELDLDISHIKFRKSYSKDTLIEAVKNSNSMRKVIKSVGLVPAGGNYKTIRRHIQELGLDTSHFTGQGHLKNKTHNWGKTRPLEQILIKNSPWKGTNTSLKGRLFKADLMDRKCYRDTCPIKDPTWCDEPLVFHLDHINGDNRDYRLTNLRLLCPCCHSQTDTYCGRNKGKYT